MRIPCPYCGDRDTHEFVYRGDADPVRPAQDDAAAFHRYVYLRRNPAGPLLEYWYHASGCRNWLIVARDTRTHEISGATLVQQHDSESGAAYPAAREVGR